jgi:arylsulfatase A-like enzyme
MDHGVEGNGTLFEIGARIAQCIHYPDYIAAGSTFDGLVSTIDIAPTILDFAGIGEDDTGYYQMDGKSWKDDIVNSLDDWSEDRCFFWRWI